jgi:lactonase family protein with 7-bladed beta-propeller
LTPVSGSPFPGHGQPNAVAIDSDTFTVYVGNRGTNDISVYHYNSSTGALTELPDSPWPSAAGAVNSLVVFDNLLDVAGDGGLTECTLEVGGTGVHCQGNPPYGQIPTAAMTHSAPHTQHPAFSTGYLIYTVAAGQIVGYDQSDPTDNFYDVPTPGSPFFAGTMPSALTATTNLLLVSNSQSNNVSVFRITTESGGVAFVGHFPAGSVPADLTLGSMGKFLFVANSGSNDVSAFSVDPATGVLAPVSGTFPTGTAPTHITTTSWATSGGKAWTWLQFWSGATLPC